jgi:uncharacterized protein (UPF0264 family)
MQLLVSVSDAEEAAGALDGGADIVDAKDPASGPLGAVTLDVFRTIAHRIAGARPLSAALGDPSTDDDAHQLAGAFARVGARFVKVGFGAARNIGDVRRLLMAAVTGAAEDVRSQATTSGAIAVAYADHPRGVTPWQLIDAACVTGAAGLLIDTADKAGPGLLALVSPEMVRAWVREASSAGLLTAIAGRLSHDDVGRLTDCGADIVGVRGAACAGGRTGRVRADQVRRLNALLNAQIV